MRAGSAPAARRKRWGCSSRSPGASTLTLEYQGPPSFFAPRNDPDALAALVERHPDAHLLAGGTDIQLWVTKQHRALGTLIYVGAVAELAEVAVSDTNIEIGAAVTYTDAHQVLAEHHPDLGELIRRLGSVQVRNAGTLGGNIGNASPVRRHAAPAHRARRRRGSATGPRAPRAAARRLLPRLPEKTALRRGEFIERLRVPRQIVGPALARAYKVSKRFDEDISAVCGAFSLVLEHGRVRDIRICYGGMAATPKRARALASRRSSGAAGRRPPSPRSGRRLMRISRRCRTCAPAPPTAGWVARNLLRKFYLETNARWAGADAASERAGSPRMRGRRLRSAVQAPLAHDEVRPSTSRGDALSISTTLPEPRNLLHAYVRLSEPSACATFTKLSTSARWPRLPASPR